jgi:predicted nucleic acid-binding protein
MRVFVDSPLLIYLNTVRDHTRRELYVNFHMSLLIDYKLCIDILVLDELIYISRKRYGVPYNVTLNFIRKAVTPYVTILNLGEEEYEYVEKILSEYSVRPSDAIHIGAMLANGITEVISEDKEYDKIPLIKRSWIES